MKINDLDNFGNHRVEFRCENEPSVLAQLRAVELA